MSETIFNFSAGPAMLPHAVLERAREEMLSLDSIGMSVMEISHRSKEFEAVLEAARSGLSKAMELPENYEVLFLQGGATMQFSMVPMNLLQGKTGDHITTGAWGVKAISEAAKFGKVNEIYSSASKGFKGIPTQEELLFSEDPAYVHYTSNETIDGVEFPYDLDAGGIPVICDASSNILSRPFDIEKYALIYAGAQKNIGPSGVTVVVIRKDLLENIPSGLPTLLDYRTYAKAGSMPNTPNTWGIYLISLVSEWLLEQGGTKAMQIRNKEKADILYRAIDSSDGFYIGHADPHARSVMNVTFRLANEELEDEFCSLAEKVGLSGLRGHRSVGGVRASIYNAMPVEGVKALVDFMADFSARR